MYSGESAARLRAQEDQYLDRAWQLEQQDRATAKNYMDQLFGMASAGGFGTSSVSGKLGLGDAEQRLASLLDNPDSIQQSAAYKFRLGQGQEALERSLGARGLLGSGNRLTELTKYGQDMASQEYDNQYSRLSDLLGQYQSAKASMIGSLAGSMSSNPFGQGGASSMYSRSRSSGLGGGGRGGLGEYVQSRPAPSYGRQMRGG